MEALQGEGGIRPGTIEFFKTARKICDETGALMIIDEVRLTGCRFPPSLGGGGEEGWWWWWWL
jgi:glutamate-1-semialdehyde aminotransferase